MNDADESLDADLIVSNQGMSVTATTTDYRTILGGVGFSKGRHYWEVTVDRLEGNPDLVFGVAQPNVNAKAMLGELFV